MGNQSYAIGGILASYLLCAACSALINHHAEGLRLLEAGRHAEAWQAFEKGYEKEPLSPFSLNNMGYVLEMRDGNLPGASRMYRRAIAACEEIEGDPAVKSLEKKARENLARVLWKMQTNPRWHVNARDPGIRGRTG